MSWRRTEPDPIAAARHRHLGWPAMAGRRWAGSLVLVSAVALAGCAPRTPSAAGPGATASAESAMPTSTGDGALSSPPTGGTEPVPTTAPPATASTPTTTEPAAAAGADPRELLARLVIDDRPHPDSGYRRDEWPHWRDIDGDGCDARQQALIAASTGPAQVDIGCTVVAGDWVSDYDGLLTSEPSALDVDHVVPLENAYISGGWAWSTDQRTRYANDQDDLWVVSATANRSKGSRPPDQWRPPNQAIWCTYASRWASIKVRWQLSATSSERDALGVMLDSCTGAPPSSVAPAPTARVVPAPTTTAPRPPPSIGSSVSFRNCTEARAAGAAPIYRGQPGYSSTLDRDHDGVACE